MNFRLSGVAKRGFGVGLVGDGDDSSSGSGSGGCSPSCRRCRLAPAKRPLKSDPSSRITISLDLQSFARHPDVTKHGN
ncbi:hypothetical protein M0802_007162 [Mischocyttarus mexicanus]|nr:hypothetical protein M0802_007162 [Mischocyttarus mexicanus]